MINVIKCTGCILCKKERMKHSKLFLKYKEKILTNQLGNSDITAFKSHLNGSRRNSTLTDQEKHLLELLIDRHKPIITPKQTEKGLNWLFKLYRNPSGRLKKVTLLNLPQQKILETFKEFRLIGFDSKEFNNYLGKWLDYRPVYRTQGKDDFFDYIAYPWQTDKQIELLEKPAA